MNTATEQGKKVVAVESKAGCGKRNEAFGHTYSNDVV
jgi:hypothetical protein